MKRRIASVVTVAATVATVVGAGVTNASAESARVNSALAVQGGKCTYNGYSGWGPFEAVSRKGKGDEKYNEGYTVRGYKILALRTGKIHDRSAAELSLASKGDKVWVTISHDKGKTWKSCGHKTAKANGQTITSTKYLHSGSDVHNRYMRACAKTGGKVWCADIGNKSNRNHSDGKKRYWWTDS
ncbi:hypothetical protein ACIO87_29315 [Streptomyces sp. NPDC087218]|uniref:hypothetical protein n=1 Tax=Streptomyces sp. NPDC087218 TaxID=3365769 RepID=UPI003812E13D